MKTVEITDTHIALLRRAYAHFDSKRPFGNSDIVGDMADAVGIKRIETDDGELVLPAGTTERMKELYDEMIRALSAMLVCGELKKGLYACDDYGTNWRFVR